MDRVTEKGTQGKGSRRERQRQGQRAIKRACAGEGHGVGTGRVRTSLEEQRNPFAWMNKVKMVSSI